MPGSFRGVGMEIRSEAVMFLEQDTPVELAELGHLPTVQYGEK